MQTLINIDNIATSLSNNLVSNSTLGNLLSKLSNLKNNNLYHIMQLPLISSNYGTNGNTSYNPTISIVGNYPVSFYQNNFTIIAPSASISLYFKFYTYNVTSESTFTFTLNAPNMVFSKTYSVPAGAAKTVNYIQEYQTIGEFPGNGSVYNVTLETSLTSTDNFAFIGYLILDE